MMLFVREQVEEFAFKKWGGEEGLDEEYEKRENIKKKRKDKKFKTKLAGIVEFKIIFDSIINQRNELIKIIFLDLRKRTRTDVLIQRNKHKHEFEEAEEDPETGVTTQSCKTCGMQIEVDIL